jgi:hypothetical protein
MNEQREERRADFRRADQLIIPQWIAVIILGAMVTFLFVTIPARVSKLEITAAENRKMIEYNNDLGRENGQKLDRLIEMSMEGRRR